MVYELFDTSKAVKLFAHSSDNMIDTALEKIAGKIIVNDPDDPVSALAVVGDFGFLAGEPDPELISAVPQGFLILTALNGEWETLIKQRFDDAVKIERYAVKTPESFDMDKLSSFVSGLPSGYELRKIDAELYLKCLESHVTRDFVSVYGSCENFLDNGLGFVIIKDGRIVSGASSYSSCSSGIQIEVDTVPEERRKHLAIAACSALIIECLNRGIEPQWDAQNMDSVRLSEKLGYHFSHAYTCYEIG